MPKQRKRTSLDALDLSEELSVPEAPQVPEPAEAVEANKTSAQPKAKGRAIKQQTLYLPLTVHEQLRHLAFEENCRMHSLVMEGLDLLFRSRGAKSIEELTK